MTMGRYVLQWALVVEDVLVNEQKFEDVEDPVITLEEAIVSEFILLLINFCICLWFLYFYVNIYY